MAGLFGDIDLLEVAFVEHASMGIITLVCYIFINLCLGFFLIAITLISCLS